MLKVFIGYDPRQAVAFNVLAHSVISRSKEPVAIIRLQLDQLPIKRRGLTEFTYSRFLVPWLCDFRPEMAIFLDADMLCLGDVNDLARRATKPFGHIPPVSVVKNKIRFEWPSLMVFHCAGCTNLTPEFIEDPKNNLYDLAWAGGDEAVGSLPSDWNHLEGYDKPKAARLVHFTMGIPCWKETAHSEYADAWRRELKAANSTVSFEALMGKSVHVQHLGKLRQTEGVSIPPGARPG